MVLLQLSSRVYYTYDLQIVVTTFREVLKIYLNVELGFVLWTHDLKFPRPKIFFRKTEIPMKMLCHLVIMLLGE